MKLLKFYKYMKIPSTSDITDTKSTKKYKPIKLNFFSICSDFSEIFSCFYFIKCLDVCFCF